MLDLRAALPPPRTRLRISLALLGLVAIGVVVNAVLVLPGLPGLPGQAGVAAVPTLLLGGLATTLAGMAVGRGRPRTRQSLKVAAVVLVTAFVLWLAVADVFIFTTAAGPIAAVGSAAACLPTTAFGLWAVRKVDRNHKEPWLLVATAAGWGGLVATTLALAVEGAWQSTAYHNLIPGPGMDASVGLGAGLLEESTKGLAMVLLYLLVRDQISGVVDGIVFGAAVGLGFNFVESISYMTNVYVIFGGDQGAVASGFQWYARQAMGLFFGHSAFTALIGAGFGIARQLKDRRARLVAILCGWLGAISAHFAWDAWLALFPLSHDLLVLLQIHLRTVVLEGPFVAVALLLVAMGLELERRALERHLAAEAAEGHGTVHPAEIPILLRPWQRFRVRWWAQSWLGLKGYRAVSRLQAAQVELGLARWHREREELERPELVDQLRARVLALRMAAGV